MIDFVSFVSKQLDKKKCLVALDMALQKPLYILDHWVLHEKIAKIGLRVID